MASTYTVKVPMSWPHIGSAQVRALLHETLTSAGAAALRPDPGAGDRILRLSLPPKQVEELAGVLGNSPAVALRRLIAPRMQAPPTISYEALFEPAALWSPVTNSPQPAASIPTGEPPTSWIDILTFLLILAAAAWVVWALYFREGNGMPSASHSLIPKNLVSIWSPLQ